MIYSLVLGCVSDIFCQLIQEESFSRTPTQTFQ